jgi:hypothetical protein
VENLIGFDILSSSERWKPQDEDTLIRTGIYQIKSSTSKLRYGFCGSQCFVLVFNTSPTNNDYVTQIAFSYYEATIAIRNRTGYGKGEIWSPWKYIS